METAKVEPTEDQRGLTARGRFFTRDTKPHDSIGQERGKRFVCVSYMIVHMEFGCIHFGKSLF